MIKTERELTGSKEIEPPCHYIFDLEKRTSTGGIIRVYGRQVDSFDKVPEGATNIRPIHEGDVIQVRYDNLAKDNPWPIREIHSHKGSTEPVFSGFETASTYQEPLGLDEGLLWKRKHPLSAGHRRPFSPPWLEY